MKYIKIEGGTGFCGTDFTEYLETEMSNIELDHYCIDAAYENADQYAYMVYGWGEDAESYAEYNDISVEEAEAEMEKYYAEAYADWEEITEEEYRNNI